MRFVHRSLCLAAFVILGAGCSAKVAVAPLPSSSESSRPPTSASGPSPTATARPVGETTSCGAISIADRTTADAYAAMLLAEKLQSTHVFVSAQSVGDDGMMGSGTGPISAAALSCLAKQVPTVTIVTGPDDPKLPTKKGTGIRELPAGPLVMFGALSLPADHSTSISIDAGGGDFHGAGYDVTVDASGVVHVVASGQAWIS
jgi:hypothetical protein